MRFFTPRALALMARAALDTTETRAARLERMRHERDTLQARLDLAQAEIKRLR